LQRLEALIRAIPDFPEPGIIFRDVTPLLGNAPAMRLTVHQLVSPFIGGDITAVAGMEARGFLFGALVAAELGVGFVPLRKPGKLPGATYQANYTLEYGGDSLEMHQDAVSAGARVLLVDDLIATGGTAAASVELLRRADACVVGCAFVIELAALGGRDLLPDLQVHSVLSY
jgi:adenine phosphoribosyltransferase